MVKSKKQVKHKSKRDINKDFKENFKKMNVERVQQHAKRMFYTWSGIAVIFIIMGFIREINYFYWAGALIIINVYWFWRGWRWKKKGSKPAALNTL